VTRTRRRRTGRVAIGAVVLLAFGGAGVAATGIGLRDHGRPTDRHLPPATAKVTRQTLVDTQTETGTLAYGGTRTVSAKLAGTLTALAATGSTVRRGDALYRVDDTPVVLLYGSLPAYRVLAPKTKGNDVKQFERNLWALGYRGFTVDKEFTADTATAVRKWQGDLGLKKTGTVEPGRVVYAPGPLRVSSRKAAGGDDVRPGWPVLACTTRARVVTVELDLTDQQLARKGAKVSVKLPDGRSVTGRITGTQTVIDSSESKDNPETKVKVTIAIPEAVSGLDEASVDVGFTASRRPNVLTVPVGALLALSEGGYGVQAVDGSATRIVAVETGLFADGQVEVSGAGLTEGMTVGVPS
jgi:peptidoglycan hydrolase-like protein with peptidoglycan-binding domain